MRRLTKVLLCALLLPACITNEIWDWANDTHPVNPQPISCGVDADGTTVILVAVAGEDQPAFCLRVPVDWSERTKIPIGESGESVHSPMYLTRESVPVGVLSELEPAPEEWFLSHEPETGSFDVLVMRDEGHVVVGTAELPSEAHWGRHLTATILTPVTAAADCVVIVGTFLFLFWLETDTPESRIQPGRPK